MRFSLLILAAAIAVLATFLTACTYASDFWVGVTGCLTIFLVGLAGINAIMRAGRQRAFWGGFALIGALYLYALGAEQAPLGSIAKFLAPAHYLFFEVEPVTREDLGAYQVNGVSTYQGMQPVVIYGNPEHVQYVCSYALCLILSSLGGMLAMRGVKESS